MIRGLILFYLNIKPTHGYEIQRFIQLSGTDKWAKIQSGSIYYALTKLEKEKNILVLKEERTGSRVRKIYKITELGKTTLQTEMKEALATPLANVGSIKFITAPMLSTLSKEEIIIIVAKHINELKEQREFWKVWKNAKAGEQEYKLTQISFQMAIDSIENQIMWHEELLNNLDVYITEASSTKEIIKTFDADRYESNDKTSLTEQKIDFANSIKEAMMSDPKLAIESLNKIIEELKNEM